jgi:pimeloyl-ACP methyl ester carboxylesterase
MRRSAVRESLGSLECLVPAVRESLGSLERLVPALLGILLAALCAAAPAAAKVRSGPAGDAFYAPPSPLPAGSHGALIWARGLSGPGLLKGAGGNRLILYRSTSVNGAATAVSGMVAVPKGKAPEGGWPVIAWAHGTTGIADQCAPSRTAVDLGYDHPLMQRWLKAGYAVVRTDYEGLGTPAAVHPYLIGVSEGRSVLDAVLAARQLEPRLSRDVMIAGHSQGGHAALWAASLAPRWTPGLKVRGTIAFAPASHVGEQAQLLRSVTTTGGITALAALILRGVDVADPNLHIASLLSPEAAALYPQTDSACLPALAQSSSFGGLAPAQLLRSDADPTPVIAALNANDPEDLKIKTPVQIEQGTGDTTVFPTFTQQLEVAYKQRGVNLVYKTYNGLTHSQVVTNAKPQADALAFIRKRLG